MNGVQLTETAGPGSHCSGPGLGRYSFVRHCCLLMLVCKCLPLPPPSGEHWLQERSGGPLSPRCLGNGNRKLQEGRVLAWKGHVITARAVWGGLGCSMAARAPPSPEHRSVGSATVMATLCALIRTHQLLCFPLVSERLLPGTAVGGGGGWRGEVVGEDGW